MQNTICYAKIVEVKEIETENIIGTYTRLDRPQLTTVVYDIPYNILKMNHDINIVNNFIVYILWGMNENNQPVIYVGESKNGLNTRPIAHEDKCSNWRKCYVITSLSQDFLNDGTIRYIENELNQYVNQMKYHINTTNRTAGSTANSGDISICDDMIEEIIKYLKVLGLDILGEIETFQNEEEIEEQTEQVNYEALVVRETVEITDIHNLLDAESKTLLETICTALQNEVNRNLEIKNNKCYFSMCLDGVPYFTIRKSPNGFRITLRVRGESFKELYDPNLRELIYKGPQPHNNLIGEYHMNVNSNNINRLIYFGNASLEYNNIGNRR